jgi:hypothetical protein
MPGDDRHGHCGRVPAARSDPAEMGLGRLFVGKVKRLRVIFAGELQHLVASDLVRSEIRLRADLQVFEIDHLRAHSGGGGLARVRQPR